MAEAAQGSATWAGDLWDEGDGWGKAKQIDRLKACPTFRPSVQVSPAESKVRGPKFKVGGIRLNPTQSDF